MACNVAGGYQPQGKEIMMKGSKTALLGVIVTFIAVVLYFFPVRAQVARVDPATNNETSHTVKVELSACKADGVTKVNYKVTSWNMTDSGGLNSNVLLEYQTQAGNKVSGLTYLTVGQFVDPDRYFSGAHQIDSEVDYITGIVTVNGEWGSGHVGGQVIYSGKVEVLDCPASTATATATATNTLTPTPTNTPTPTQTKAIITSTTVATITLTLTKTPTPTPTFTPTATPTKPAVEVEYGSLSVSAMCDDVVTQSPLFFVSNNGKAMTEPATWRLVVNGVQEATGVVKLGAGEYSSFEFEPYKGVLEFSVSFGQLSASAKADTATCKSPTIDAPVSEPFRLVMKYNGTVSQNANGEAGAYHSYAISCSSPIFVIMEAELADGTAETRTGNYCQVSPVAFKAPVSVARFYDISGMSLAWFKFSNIGDPASTPGTVYLPFVVR